MLDEASTTGTGTNTGTDNKSGNEGATGANTNTSTQNPQAFDPKTVGDEDFSKVFDDPRVWNHPRFKSLNEQAKKAKEYEEKEAQRVIEEQKKKGEWEAVAKANEEKAQKALQQFQTAQADNRIQSEAAKLGVVDLDAVTKLIDRTNIKVNEDGTVTGVEDAVKGLIEAKPYLKGSQTQPTVGNGTAPGAENTTGLKRFKMSQLQDARFYRENEKDISASMAAGLVEDDMSH